ncbi:ABC transporter substrate-binding protein [Salipaludibacillus neizhouensis]|uniref:ABC transporter substrate-binding protein n=1 Tax=Salipaludibacillus neizhouensis TaxID=885475 RepID=A0A3A9K4D7_9BACI|nr:extracellular solute-binding protein [Salipaludibacillus neizhouensis]RKL65171.1 ABC transporter substrate-binding protein [Salipaludibacillus neizhouensis]
MRKTNLLTLISSVMLITLLGACSDNENETSSTSNTSENDVTLDDDMKFSETVSLNIPVYDRAFENWNVSDNYYTNWIQDEFGEQYNIDVNFVPISRGSEVTDFQQLLSAGNAPHIIYNYDMPLALSYYSSGVFQPLDLDEIAEYAPTYWEKLSGTIDQYGMINEENVFFFAERPDISNFVSIIRKDWVEEVGMEVEDLTSLEKFNEMAMKWKEAGLGTLGGGLTENIYNYNYAFRDWPIDPEYRALYSDLMVADFTTEDTERWLRNLSNQYHNGLINQEFYLLDANRQKTEFVAGRSGIHGEYISSNTDLFEATLKNNPDAEFAVVPPYARVPEGREAQGRANFPFGLIMGINEKATEEERIAVWMYLEWMSQPDNLFFLQNGVEGDNYTLDSEGFPVKNEEFDGESSLAMNNNKDYWSLVTEAPYFGSEELTHKAMESFWSPSGYEYIVDDMFKYQEQVVEYLKPDALFTVVIESQNRYQADLNALFQELYLKVVMAPEENFDEEYEAAKQRYLEAGYQEILDEKQKAIDEDKFLYFE